VQEGDHVTAPDASIIDESGAIRVYKGATESDSRAARVEAAMGSLTESCSSLFAETWGRKLGGIFEQAATLAEMLDSNKLLLWPKCWMAWR
jgi:hypothetical protein